jgi:hypothetical protein
MNILFIENNNIETMKLQRTGSKFQLSNKSPKRKMGRRLKYPEIECPISR